MLKNMFGLIAAAAANHPSSRIRYMLKVSYPILPFPIPSYPIPSFSSELSPLFLPNPNPFSLSIALIEQDLLDLRKSGWVARRETERAQKLGAFAEEEKVRNEQE